MYAVHEHFARIMSNHPCLSTLSPYVGTHSDAPSEDPLPIRTSGLDLRRRKSLGQDTPAADAGHVDALNPGSVVPQNSLSNSKASVSRFPRHRGQAQVKVEDTGDQVLLSPPKKAVSR